MAANKNKTIAVKLSLSTLGLQKGIKKASFQLKKFAKGVMDVSRTVATSAGLIAVAFGKQFVTEFVNFEFAMAKVKAITQSTSKEFKSLKDEALRLGAQTQLTAVQVSGLQLVLSKLGFKSGQINKMTESIASLSIALGEDLALSGKTMGSVLKSFEMDASKSTQVVDTMATAFSSSALDLSSFADTMKYVSSIAHQSGDTLEDLTSKMGILADRGIASSTQGTALRTMYIKNAVAGRGYRDSLKEIREAQDQVSKAFELFGKVAAPTAVILANTEQEVDNLRYKLLVGADAAAKMRHEMENTAFGALKRLESAFSALSIKVGEAIYQYISPLINKLITLANTIDTDTIAKITLLVAKIAGGAGLVWAFGLVGDKIISLGKSIISLGETFFTLGRILSGLNPILLAIGLVIYGIYKYMSENWTKIESIMVSWVNYWIDLYNESGLFAGIVDGISGVLYGMWEGFKTDIELVIDSLILLGETLAALAFDGVSAAGKVFDKGFEDMAKKVEETNKRIEENWKETTDVTTREPIKPMKDGDITKVVNSFLDPIKEGVATAKAFISGIMNIEETGAKPYKETGDPNRFLNALNDVDYFRSKSTKQISSKKPKNQPLGAPDNPEYDAFKEQIEDRSLVGAFVEQWESAINSVMEIFNVMFDFISRGYENQIIETNKKRDAEIAAIESSYITAKDKKILIGKVNEKADKKEAALKLKQWKSEKAASLTQILIKGALAVVNAYASSGPIGAAVAGAAVAASFAFAASQQPPKFAEGGIVSGRTLAEVGEYSGVKSNPEVIAPLDKLKKMIGVSEPVYIYGEFVQRGSDLVAVINLQNKRDKRY